MIQFIDENIINIITTILSIIAIVVSIVTFIKGNKLSRKVAEKTLNQKFFEEVFLEYIVSKFPNELVKLEDANIRTKSECSEIEEIVSEILNKAMFYKYFDKDFYDKIKTILLDIDEKIVLALDNEINRHLFDEYKSQIIELTNRFYSILKAYYSGI